MSSVKERAIAAVKSGSLGVLEDLLRSDASVASLRDDSGVSLPLLACYHRQMGMVELLLRAGPPLDIFDTAALPGLEERGKQLLESDSALARARSGDGFTAL